MKCVFYPGPQRYIIWAECFVKGTLLLGVAQLFDCFYIPIFLSPPVIKFSAVLLRGVEG